MIEAVHTAIESESVHRPLPFALAGRRHLPRHLVLAPLNRNEIQEVITSGGTIHFLAHSQAYFMKILAGDRDSPSVREMRKLAVAGSK